MVSSECMFLTFPPSCTHIDKGSEYRVYRQLWAQLLEALLLRTGNGGGYFVGELH